MHNQLPIKDENVEVIHKWLEENGPATAREVEAATGHSMNQVVRAFNRGYLARTQTVDGKTNLYLAKPGALLRIAAGYVGEIVPSAEPKPFKPLRGYTAQLLAGKREGIREMSFLRSSTQFLPRQ